MFSWSAYYLYTDWACSGNPWPGWWGVVVLLEGKIVSTLSWLNKYTTNNEMELKAVIEWLKRVCCNNDILIDNDLCFQWFDFNGKHETSNKKEVSSFSIEVYLDSQYVKNGIELWISNWRKNWWKNSKKKIIANLSLRKELDNIVWQLSVNRHRVKWHAGNIYNEMADKLATNKI